MVAGSHASTLSLHSRWRSSLPLHQPKKSDQQQNARRRNPRNQEHQSRMGQIFFFLMWYMLWMGCAQFLVEPLITRQLPVLPKKLVRHFVSHTFILKSQSEVEHKRTLTEDHPLFRPLWIFSLFSSCCFTLRSCSFSCETVRERASQHCCKGYGIYEHSLKWENAFS